jgi:hypothetical protein
VRLCGARTGGQAAHEFHDLHRPVSGQHAGGGADSAAGSIQLSEFGVFDWIRDSDAGSSVLLRFLPMLVSAWLGISVLMHAFPSTGDAKALVHSILKNKDVNIFVRIWSRLRGADLCRRNRLGRVARSGLCAAGDRVSAQARGAVFFEGAAVQARITDNG